MAPGLAALGGGRRGRQLRLSAVTRRGCTFLFFDWHGDPRDLHKTVHSFPTRRSSDLRLRIAFDSLIELARRMEKHGRVITKDPLWRQKLAQLWIDTECLRVTGARAITKLLRGEMPGAEASTGKMVWVETHQRLQELAMELEGSYGQLAKGSEWAVEGGVWQHSFLRSQANSIEGGTTEIQKNIIAERLLGLPKD